MELKRLVSNIAENKNNERINFIEDYLRSNSIEYIEKNYQYGKNIEIKVTGINASKEIIFFAHYDISDKTREGANDNSSSVAVLLKVAEFIILNKPLYTVRLVFNDKEELLGALNFEKLGVFNYAKIINCVGSYNYLKNIENKSNIAGIFDLELSGIGDTVYLANKSGNILCNQKLIDYCMKIASKYHINHVNIPVHITDMVSIHSNGLSGVVYGAIPGFAGERLSHANILDINSFTYPAIWKNMHTEKDSNFSIQEKALQMVYEFTIALIKNCSML